MIETVAITGGTGHLGICLINELLGKGSKVIALYYKSQPRINNPNLKWIQGDLNDMGTMSELISGCQVLIHCAAAISIHGDPLGIVHRTNVEGTGTVVQACLEHQPKIRLVHISSTQAVSQKPTGTTYNENRPLELNSKFAYNKTKAIAEQQVINAIESNHLDAIILRLPALVGIYDYRPSLLGKVIIDIYNGKLPALTSGGFNYADIQDVSKSIIRSTEKGKSGETYLLAGKYYSIKQLAEEIAYHSNHRASKVIIPIWLMMVFLPFVKIYSLLSQQQSPFTYESLMVLKYGHKNMDSSKAEKAINHTVRPLSETIKNFIEWLRKENMIE